MLGSVIDIRERLEYVYDRVPVLIDRGKLEVTATSGVFQIIYKQLCNVKASEYDFENDLTNNLIESHLAIFDLLTSAVDDGIGGNKSTEVICGTSDSCNFLVLQHCSELYSQANNNDKDIILNILSPLALKVC